MENNTNREHQFFFAYTIFLLAIVFIGFTPSLFLRPAFDTPPIPFYLHLHGGILTGWFVWLVAQAWLIRTKNPALHRKLGYFAATYGLVVVFGSLMATLNVVSRDMGLGITLDVDMSDIDPALGSGITYLTFITAVIWNNITAVCTFAVLIIAAVYFRSSPDIHKRLLLVASVSIIGPALARISRLEILGGEQGPFIPLAALSLLLAILVYDFSAIKKLHKTSLAAIVYAISLKVAAGRIASSEFGQDFVRNLA